MIKTKDELSTYLLKKTIDDNKLKILKLLNGKSSNPMELAKKLNLSPPLVAYHINGNKKTEGMVKLGLVKKTYNDVGTPKDIEITSLGKEILKVLK